MKQLLDCAIIYNKKISTNIYEMLLDAKSIAKQSVEGQFVEVYLSNNKNLLPRPISICEVNKDKGTVKIVYKTLGDGTLALSKYKERESIKILGPLGNGFTLNRTKSIAIIGGGVGVPPLLWLTKSLVIHNVNSYIDIFLGFTEYPILIAEFEKIKSGYNEVNMYPSSVAGHIGFKGNVIECMKNLNKKYDLIYACGPKNMLKAVSEYSMQNNIPAQISLEEKMACGIGACVGCIAKIKDGDSYFYKKVCNEGPVFDAKEVIFDE